MQKKPHPVSECGVIAEQIILGAKKCPKSLKSLGLRRRLHHAQRWTRAEDYQKAINPVNTYFGVTALKGFFGVANDF
jgi:hypothetical protein